MEKLNDYIDFCSKMQRPGSLFCFDRCSLATPIYLALAALGASTAAAGAFVADTVCAVAGFLACFLDFLVAGVALVEVFFISALASGLAAIGAATAGAGAAAGMAAGALAGAAGAVVAGEVCAAAVSDTANAPAIS